MLRVANTQARQRPRDSVRTRDALIEAAAAEFNRHGYFNTDTNRIAAAAGYAPASFYKHFTDKREVFLEVYAVWVEREWAEIGELLTARMGRRRMPGRLAKAALEHHKRWPLFRADLTALAATDPQVMAARLKSRRRQIDVMTELLCHAGAASPSRARVLSVLLSFERICDAVAWGEAESLGVSERSVLRELRRVLRDLFG